MRTASVWLSFDLGVDGDYENLYFWLDRRDAVECGDNLAYFRFEYKRDLVAELQRELRKTLSVRPRDRVYVIYPAPQGKHKGRFILGRRKPGPWAGVAGKVEETIDES